MDFTYYHRSVVDNRICTLSMKIYFSLLLRLNRPVNGLKPRILLHYITLNR